MKLFCDMDGVLVKQTGRDGFDLMPWMPDGKDLWAFIAPLKPTILSMLPNANIARCEPQKRAWCARELGAEVAVVITPDSIGKGPHATPGAVLIDDDFHESVTPAQDDQAARDSGRGLLAQAVLLLPHQSQFRRTPDIGAHGAIPVRHGSGARSASA